MAKTETDHDEPTKPSAPKLDEHAKVQSELKAELARTKKNLEEALAVARDLKGRLDHAHKTASTVSDTELRGLRATVEEQKAAIAELEKRLAAASAGKGGKPADWRPWRKNPPPPAAGAPAKK